MKEQIAKALPASLNATDAIAALRPQGQSRRIQTAAKHELLGGRIFVEWLEEGMLIQLRSRLT